MEEIHRLARLIQIDSQFLKTSGTVLDQMGVDVVLEGLQQAHLILAGKLKESGVIVPTSLGQD